MNRLDLIYDKSPPREASRSLHEALTFCFARGESEDRVVELCEPELGESTFSAQCFAGDLFLGELLQGCFPLVVSGRRLEPSRFFLQKLIVAPPDRGSLELRQKILAELCERPGLAKKMEEAYTSLRAFRGALSGVDAVGGRISHLRRRVEILTALRDAVSCLTRLGEGADSQIRRVAEWTEQLEATEPYQRLLHLLNFEDKRTVLESRLQLGYDGSLRRFEIVGVSRSEHKGFSSSRFSRFFRRLAALLKGYRFSDEDVMSQLLDQVFGDLEESVAELIGCSLQLEFYLCALGFRRFCQEKGYATCLPRFVFPEQDDHRRLLKGLFNPWLAVEDVRPVLCDDEMEDAQKTVIITGPNSGGKTRFLQSVAIAQLLGQSGLFVPAKDAQLVWVEQIYLSLLERVEASQAEGRLGMELMRIRHVFETSGQRSLIVMDELCSGTNPSEGEQIFEMVLGLLEELKPQVLISTHFLDFANRLREKGRARLRFLQVELGPHDVPTYRFVPGVAETSLARNTAARLGVTRDELLGLVEAHKRRAQTRESN